jgi:poly-gamma-glutamate capsule biosynthesis protein CapA/YwtB (metallophosphatase superfamily)
LAPIASALSAADVTVVNLETAITDRGEPEPNTYAFRVGPVALEALAAAGVDVVTMANNHAVDYGAAGLADTLAAVASAPLPVVGIGVDDEQAFAPAVLDVRGTTVAVLGATDIPDRTAAAWSAGSDSPGVASTRDPDRLLRAVSEAGTAADAVVGSHAHVLLGARVAGSHIRLVRPRELRLVHADSTADATSGVLTLTVRERSIVADLWTPTFTRQDGMPRVETGPDAERAVADWVALRDCIGLEGSLDGAETMS